MQLKSYVRIKKILLGAGAFLFLAGLIALLVGMFGVDVWAAPVMIAGGSVAAAGAAVLVLHSFLWRKWEREFHDAVETQLPEDECLLTPVHIGKFTNEGLFVRLQGDVFDDPNVSEVTPYGDMIVYYFTERAKPAKKGRDQKLLFIGGRKKVDGDGLCLPLEGRTESLAVRYGVQVVDKRTQAVRQRILRKFYHSAPHMRKIGLLAFFGAAIAFMVTLGAALYAAGQLNSASAGMYIGTCAIISVCIAAACASLLRREQLTVYENGIRLYFFRRGCNLFLPMDTVERLEKIESDLVISMGFSRFWFPDNGAYDFLREKFPEKCEECGGIG